MVVEGQNQDNNIEIRVERNPYRTLVKWLSGIFFIALIVVLILIGVYTEGSNLGWIIGSGVVLGIAAGIIFFIFELVGLFSKKRSTEVSELPPMITINQATKLCEDVLFDKFANEFGRILKWGTETHGRVKQNIFYMVVEGKFHEVSQPATFFIGINMHYPNDHMSVIPNPTSNDIRYAIRKLSRDPEDDPDMESRIERDLSTGKETVYTKRSKSKDKESVKKKEGDLS